MPTAPRIVLAADSASDASRAQALLEAGRLASSAELSHEPQKARELLLHAEGWELLIFVCPKNSPELRSVITAIRAAHPDFPIIFLADELSAELSTVANLFGARICLFSLGVRPLESAVAGATKELEQRREHDERLRRDLDDAVRASEHKRALVYVSVADVIFYLKVEGERFRFEEINPAFTRATGLTEDQVLGKFVDEVIPEPSLSLALGKYREAIRERRTVRWDEITHYPTGKKYGEVSITPVVDSAGNCTNLIGTVQDVTEARLSGETIRQYANIVSSVQISLSVWTVTDVNHDAGVKLDAFNPAAETASGVRLAHRIGQGIREIFPGDSGEHLSRMIRGVAKDGVAREDRSFRFSDSPGRIFAARAFLLSGGSVAVSVDDVTSEARARELTEAETTVLELVASGAPLEKTLAELVKAIEQQAAPAIGSVQLVSDDGSRIVHGAAPHLPEAYNSAIDGAPIGLEEGSCGAAAATGQAIIVHDVEIDPRWVKYRELARQFGLRACWSTPIFASDGRVLGTFALYYKEPRSPAEGDLELIRRATHVAALAIQRHELDQQLRQLTARLEEVREQERTGIARELHDELGQSLTALKLELAWISRHATSPEGLSIPDLIAKTKELMATTDALINELRRISSDLRPGVLDDVGLVSALAWQAQQFERRTHISCVVQSELPDRPLRREVATTVFRVFQEALTNVVRHADATRVDVRLEQRDGTLALRVEDDGKGIRQEKIRDPHSLGLLGIRERARRIGGNASVVPATPHGTIVELEIPLEPQVRQ